MKAARSVRSSGASTFIAAAACAGVLEMVLLALWQRNGYWDFSDGVYAETAREVLHGVGLYHAVLGAQPPPVYLLGALLLAVHDGLASLRAGLALFDLATAALVGLCVWRLSERRWLALAAGLAAPLLPISLHEHAQLTPETLAAPLIMLGAVWCARRERSVAGGAVLALAVACKLAFLLPALAIVLVAASRRRAVAGLASTGALVALATLLAFGTAVWTQAVRAQFELGRASLHYVAGLVAQAGWNECSLVVGAVAAAYLVHRGRRSPNPDAVSRGGGLAGSATATEALLRTLLAAALAGLALALSLFKHGSYINVFVVAEPPLLVLASYGAVLAWGSRLAAARAAVVLLALLVALQSASLLLSPTHAVIARRPFARSGLEEAMSPAAVSRAVALARRCPAASAYSGAPYIAFLADRRMPGDQPDLFMLRNAAAVAAFARRAAADQPRCPL